MQSVVEEIVDDLRGIHASVGLVQTKFEKRGCRMIAERFFSRGIPAFASVAYPESARTGRQRADECDLVIRVNGRDWLWIEKKVIWKGPGAAHHYLRKEAVADARKMDGLRRPEASYAGLLMIGLDATKRESARLPRDVDGIYVPAARLATWRRSQWELEPVDAYRVHVWFWWRTVDDAPF